jgi:hypothetical protein
MCTARQRAGRAPCWRIESWEPRATYPARTTKPDATATEVVVDVDTDKVRELTLPSEIIAAIDKQAKAQGFEAHLLKVEIRGKFSN